MSLTFCRLCFAKLLENKVCRLRVVLWGGQTNTLARSDDNSGTLGRMLRHGKRTTLARRGMFSRPADGFRAQESRRGAIRENVLDGAVGFVKKIEQLIIFW